MTGGHRKEKAPREDKEPLKYLRDTPPVFKEIADVLLILDSGEELPTHRCVACLVTPSLLGKPGVMTDVVYFAAGKCSP
jgi:hypothetical protein